jgi:hypothetical protein
VTTLFASDSQYRERATIWRVFSLLPLFANLADGRVFRWFAINIQMDLGTGGTFTSDIDIIARLHDFPNSQEWFYSTYEVKVALLCRDGTARSLKAGKTRGTLKQLHAYRKYGAPSVSLLDVFLCESGFLLNNSFPPPSIMPAVDERFVKLRAEQFGYRLLAFEHGADEIRDVGLYVPIELGGPHARLLAPQRTLPPGEPFSKLVRRLDEFYEGCSDPQMKREIVFCKNCKSLQLIKMRDEHECPNCRDDLIAQS